jgi:hypothetical protein
MRSDAGNKHHCGGLGHYDGDGWPTPLVANDFGTKNLYHNLGRRDGRVRSRMSPHRRACSTTAPA